MNVTIIQVQGTPPADNIQGYTNENGVYITTNNELEHFYNLTKPGYFPSLNNYVNVTSDENIIYYMTPISEDGISRVRFNDLTGVDHEYCIYYAENDRLEGCYGLNGSETVQLIVNHEYLIKPKIELADGLTSIKNMDKMSSYWMSYIIPVGLLLSFIALGVTLIFYKRK